MQSGVNSGMERIAPRVKRLSLSQLPNSAPQVLRHFRANSALQGAACADVPGQ